ncbi:MAG: substrate-binding domain-containing protein [Acidobacterium ailaaui]|nr:substrate-binding domain-containing protein [Pseudacidobacterium ailaaui]
MSMNFFDYTFRTGFFPLCMLLLTAGCHRGPYRVAVIPRTTALTIWEAVHAGVEFAARPAGILVYWNAPTSEDDIQQQAALVDRVVDEHYQGLILAPDQPLALMAPVRRAIAHGVHTVVIASPLSVPAQQDLAYIVNDDEATGRMAARRLGEVLHGQGQVAVLGVNPESLSDLAILHAFESELAEHFPQVVIADRRTGTHNATEAQQIADEVLATHPAIRAVFSLSAMASNGAIAALQGRDLTEKVKLIGFEQSVELGNEVRTGAMDALIAEDTYEMGHRALVLLAKYRSGHLPAQELRLQPVLLTRENIDSPLAKRLMNRDWGRKP